MHDTEYRRLIQEAKDKALLVFLAVVQRAMQDADRNLAELLVTARSGPEQTALTGVRHFLRQEGNVFLRSVDAAFRRQIERAMQTMYTDLRAEMRDISADKLSLIDDEVVNQQIEVGRLVQRLRDAHEESIGRLNVIIATLHGQVEARERENPFRPYLLARALFDAARETAADEVKEKQLYEHLSNALVPHLESFYGAVRKVFEASGLHGNFVAQRSRAARHQRYFGAPGQTAAVMPIPAPTLERAVEVLARLGAMVVPIAPPPPQSGNDGYPSLMDLSEPAEPPSIQALIRDMLRPGQPRARKPGPSLDAKASDNALVARLDGMQKNVAAQAPAEGDDIDPKALAAQLDLDKASIKERMTVEVVGMLFALIAEDERLPVPLRACLSRMQMPLLKAALIEPEVLHDESHPARRLLNRMNAVALATDPGSEKGRRLADEVERQVTRVLREFDGSTAVFGEVLAGFEAFLAEHVRDQDDGTARVIEAVESAERYSVLLTNTTRALCDVLLPLNLDKTISDFVIAVWPHVLVQAAWRDQSEGGKLLEQYRTLLIELIWSVQEKSSPHERAVLMKILPALVRRLRAAMEMVELPEEDAQPVLDQLVAIHTRILRGPAKGGKSDAPDLEQLRTQFARVAVNWGRASWELSEPPQVREQAVEDALAHAGTSAEQHLRSAMPASAADRDFLAQTYLLGTRVEMRGQEGEKGRSAQLVWISTHRSLYLFRRDDAQFVLYSPSALLEALEGNTVMPLEYAPVFERAVESLLFGAEKFGS